MKKDISDKNNSCNSNNDNNSRKSSKSSDKSKKNGSTPARPSVAVVMCTYNGEKFLREQLDSILDQTYPISEIIIQDDRSTDGTVALLREYEEPGQTHQNYSDKNCNILNCKTLIINVLDLLILDIFRIFIV